MTLHVGVTATREGGTAKQLGRFLREMQYLAGDFGPQNVCLHHGDCIGGDAQADLISYMLEVPRVVHPPDDPRYRAFCQAETILDPRPYLDRNHDIVESDLYVLFAIPKERDEAVRSGTWATVRYAIRRKVNVHIITPSGRMERK